MARMVYTLLAALLLCVVGATTALGQNPYRWNRTLPGGGQVLGAGANVTVTAQGQQNVDNVPRETTGGDFHFLGATSTITRTAFGGGGGGGGDSGEMFPNTLDGEDGAEGDGEEPVDGADGRPGNAFSGLGGDAGANGFADASGTTLCEDALSPDGQTVFSYSWIHNQWGDLDLAGGDGGGGGGAGSTFVDNFEPAHFAGGNGGAGGWGANATGTVQCTQNSDVNATAICQDRTVPPLAAPPPRLIEIDFLAGWVSAANPDWIDATGPGVWQRWIAMAVVVGNTSFTITGGPNGPITAQGTDDTGAPFFITGTSLLNADTGSFGLGQGDIGLTTISPNQQATILVPQGAPIQSILRGAMGVNGGIGGLGGQAFDDDAEDLVGGGAGGEGGIADETPEFFIVAGGDGGRGAGGEALTEHKDGIYEGWIIITIL